LEARIGSLDEELALAVRQQSQLAGKALDDLDVARRAVGELHAKVKNIRSKAEDSEARVEIVCRDITRLDRAKTNLTATMTALKRAAMFLAAVDQLEFFTQSRKYSQAAEILVAVSDLNTHFDGYDNVPKIREMRAMVTRLRDELTKSVFEDMQGGLGAIDEFNYGGMGGDTSAFYPDGQTPEALQGACAVADQLSEKTRRTLRKTLCATYLQPYDSVFTPGSSEDAGLEKADRRFAWIRRVLEANSTLFETVFPPSWHMEEEYVRAFCQHTHEHFATLLEQPVAITTMMKAMKKATEFETRLEEEFPVTPEGMALAQASGGGGGGGKDDAAVPFACPGRPWHGVITSVFLPHMGRFVAHLSDLIREAVDTAMVDELVEQTQRPKDAKGDLGVVVYTSSAQLFQSFKHTMTLMLEYSRAGPFVDLCVAYKERLNLYADALEKRAIGTRANAPTSSSLDRSAPRGATALLPPSLTDQKENQPLDSAAARALCLAINTADYMTEEIPALAKQVARRIDPALASKVDFSPEKERFLDAASRFVISLATRLAVKLDTHLEAISKTNWATFKDPGDQSMYVRTLTTTLREIVPVVAETITNSVFFRSFCDGLAGSFLKKLQAQVSRCKRVGEFGAQQLFVDMSAIESALLEVPSMGQNTMGAATFKRFVETGMRRHKMLFKVLGMQAPLDMIVENFSSLLGPSASMVLFNQVLDLRGVTKSHDRALACQMAKDAGVPDRVEDDKTAEEASVPEPTSAAPAKPVIPTPVAPKFPGLSAPAFLSSYKQPVTPSVARTANGNESAATAPALSISRSSAFFGGASAASTSRPGPDAAATGASAAPPPPPPPPPPAAPRPSAYNPFGSLQLPNRKGTPNPPKT